MAASCPALPAFLHPAFAILVRGGDLDVNPQAAKASRLRPGSEAKIQLLALRASRREELFQPHDWRPGGA